MGTRRGYHSFSIFCCFCAAVNCSVMAATRWLCLFHYIFLAFLVSGTFN